MNLYEAQDFFKQMYKDKKVVIEFDDKCIRKIECIYTDGNLHDTNHIEYRNVKVSVEGMESVYVPIQPHRMLISADQIKQKIPNATAMPGVQNAINQK
jgi:hypothetical protein